MLVNHTKRCWLELVILFLLLSAAPVLAGSWVYFPMMADGKIGQGIYKTHYTIHGAGKVYLTFLDTGGQYFTGLELECPEQPGLNGVKSSVEFNLDDSGGMATIYTSGQGNLKTGWAYICAEETLSLASCTYSYIDPGNIFQHIPPTILWEAAVPAAEAMGYCRIPVTVSRNEPNLGSVNTGMAVANPNREPIEITAWLSVPNQLSGKATIHLPALGQQAMYVNSLFAEQNFGERSTGEVELRSDSLFFAMALRSSFSRYEVCSYVPVQGYDGYPKGEWTEFEPNDTLETANCLDWISGGDSECSSITLKGKNDSDGEDYYRIYLKKGQKVTLALMNVAGRLDYDGRLTMILDTFFIQPFGLGTFRLITLKSEEGGYHYFCCRRTGAPYSSYTIIVTVSNYA